MPREDVYVCILPHCLMVDDDTRDMDLTQFFAAMKMTAPMLQNVSVVRLFIYEQHCKLQYFEDVTDNPPQAIRLVHEHVWRPLQGWDWLFIEGAPLLIQAMRQFASRTLVDRLLGDVN